MQPTLHPRTKKQLEQYIALPPHGVVLTGQKGSGKLYVAQWLAKNTQSSTMVITAEADKSTISIDQIRELYNLTRTGAELTIIIEDAHTMSSEAQNAFLKLLEEPPKNTRFILTANQPDALLQTVRSRLQEINILPPTKDDLKNAAPSSELNITGLLHTTERLAGTYFTLLEDEKAYQAHQQSIDRAKEFYSGSTYKRHLLCIEHKHDKAWSSELMRILAIIMHTLLVQAVQKNEDYTKILKQIELLEITSYNLHALNGNPKIHLARLCEELG